MSTNKRILFITKSFYPLFGGVEKHVKEVAEILQENRYTMVVYTRFIDKKTSRERLKYTKTHKVEIVEIKYKDIKILGLFQIWFEMLKRTKEVNGFEIVHIHDVFIWYLPIRVILFWKKVYTTFHGWEGKYPIPYKNKFIRKLSVLLSTRHIEIGDYISKFYGTKKDVVLYGATEKLKKITKKKRNKVVYVGRLAKDTGLTLFLEFFKKNKRKVHVEFCGDGELLKECKKYGKTHGFVDPKNYIKDANIVFASGYLSILESLANKSKVIVSQDNPLKKSYYEDAPFRDWIYICNNLSEIEKSFDKTLVQSREADKKVENAFNWVSKLTWENLAEEYLNLWCYS